MLKHLDFLETTLCRPCASIDSELYLHAGTNTLKRLNSLSEGDTAYFVISVCGRHEAVRYTHTDDVKPTPKGLRIYVERGVHGTTAQSFPAMAVFDARLTSNTIKELCAQERENGNV